MWPCTLFLVILTDLSQRPMGVARVNQAGMAPTHWMGLRDLFTQESNTLPVFLCAAHTTCSSTLSGQTHHTDDDV